MEFTEQVESVLRAAGWERERSVDVSEWRSRFGERGIDMHDAAAAFLAEFGGLTVEAGGSGAAFPRESFELDPSLAYGEEERFTAWSEIIGHSLFPLGELDRGRFFLAIDEETNVYLVADWIAGFGAMPGAMENLISGGRPERLDVRTD
ncbi:SUKH-3 domain-containing protein [Nonomuraea pusilla]|uniref:SUKH-3 domain-containing protein n=1 Tax=Nonomuraea pusilla TaxID=46177 RepID=UPI003324536E